MIWQKRSPEMQRNEQELSGEGRSVRPELGTCPYHEKCTVLRREKGKSGKFQVIQEGPVQELSNPIS